MKKFLAALKRFFFPPESSSTMTRILPLAVIAVVMLVVFVAMTVTWEFTNSTEFCGTACHTMPPEYISLKNSDHGMVFCEDCHLGRTKLGEQIVGKIQYSWNTGTAMLFNTYEYPIRSKNMRPARIACELCHKPEVFTNDKLISIKRFAEDRANTQTTVTLIMKTGGGTKRSGLGYGIHWHVENQVDFLATDPERQDIPYVRVKAADGSVKEYFDIQSDFKPENVKEDKLERMDCISCHNRTGHPFQSPTEIVNTLMANGVISTKIPDIRKKAVEVMSGKYTSEAEAMKGIASLETYYKEKEPAFYGPNQHVIKYVVEQLQYLYSQNEFIFQKVNWQTHPDDITHRESAGCFRCHDGKHLTKQGEAVRLECNICHSIPVSSFPNQFNTVLNLAGGFEPESHKNTNFITLHRDYFDNTCANCHTVTDPGAATNTSFCSNSVCHGEKWRFAGFDAPKLRETLKPQLQKLIPTPGPTKAPAPAGTSAPAATQAPGATQPPVATQAPGAALTWNTGIADILAGKCAACHGQLGGLNLGSYASAMKGGSKGVVIVARDAKASSLIQLMEAGGHPAVLTPEELSKVSAWINAGAPEK